MAYPISMIMKLIIIISELMGELPTGPYDTGGIKSASAVEENTEAARAMVGWAVSWAHGLVSARGGG